MFFEVNWKTSLTETFFTKFAVDRLASVTDVGLHLKRICLNAVFLWTFQKFSNSYSVKDFRKVNLKKKQSKTSCYCDYGF